MSIIGIDKEKCSNCEQCIQECGRGFFYVDEEGQVQFNDNGILCNICGHCIAICPEDAILTKNLDDIDTSTSIESPADLVDGEKLIKLFRSKRSIRRYKDKKVPRELIEKVFKAMQYAPSAFNARSWRYVILSDSEVIQKLNDEVVKGAYAYMGFQNAEQALEYQKSTGRSVFYNAPHVIVLYYRIVEKSTTMVGLKANDAGIALTYGMLEAESLGLGTCWIGLVQGAVPVNKEILKILGIKGMILGAFTLGYPAVKYRRPVSRPPLKIKGLD
ncbi:MAG: nitroreductase family protein [Promethearchaeota archaeon]|jgi:nitroreductase/NAD-dependent dihydropyrimidine dehydrogenase PreA subunit